MVAEMISRMGGGEAVGTMEGKKGELSKFGKWVVGIRSNEVLWGYVICSNFSKENTSS